MTTSVKIGPWEFQNGAWHRLDGRGRTFALVKAATSHWSVYAEDGRERGDHARDVEEGKAKADEALRGFGYEVTS